MIRLRLAQIICRFFPPPISQRIRTFIFPINLAVKSSIDFSKRSITGSIFKGNTIDFHSYTFSVHGYFDWRNIVIASSIIKNSAGDIIEIGANIGTETIGYCDILDNRYTVHAFEPLPENLKHLHKITGNNKNISNLKIYPFAVSDKETEFNFMIPPVTSSGTGKIIDENEEGIATVKVKAVVLDNLLDHFNSVKLVTIDTEGHESFVLRGCTELIKKFRPSVITEVVPKLLLKYGHSEPGDIYKYFAENKYACFRIGRFSLVKINENKINGEGSSNWFCCPLENKLLIRKVKRELFLRSILPWNKIRL